MHDAAELVRNHLADAGAGWAIGGLGAVAEFLRDPEEMAEIALSDRGGLVTTARGAIRIGLPDGAVARAYETSGEHGAPLAAIAITLPEMRALGVNAVTELGPDGEAIRAADRDALLFDLGVGVPHISFCVRTGDAALIAALRGQAGGLMWPALGAIVASQPHRICRSDAGRIEVYQPIPIGRDAATPYGPHTHLLPDLLGKPGPSHALDLYPGMSHADRH